MSRVRVIWGKKAGLYDIVIRPDGLKIECRILGVCVVQRAVRVSQRSSEIGTEQNP